MAEEQSASEAGTGAQVGVLTAAITAIVTAGDESLTFGRGVIDREEGFVLRELDDSLTEAQQAARFVDTRPAVATESLIADVESLYEELAEALDFGQAQSFPVPDLLEKLADLLLNPTYDPDKACLAPAPLLRDLLDVALGRAVGGLGAVVAEVGQTVWDFLLPAGVEGDDLTHFVESILADPITAALNFILGKRDEIDCVVTGGLGVGQRVIETVLERLEGVLIEALP